MSQTSELFFLNPFRSYLNQPNPLRIYGRTRLLFQLVNLLFVSNVPAPCIISGPRYIGKSTLIQALQNKTYMRDLMGNKFPKTYSLDNIEFIRVSMKNYAGSEKFEQFLRYLLANAQTSSGVSLGKNTSKIQSDGMWNSMKDMITAAHPDLQQRRLVIILDDAGDFIKNNLNKEMDRDLKRTSQDVGMFLLIDDPIEDIIPPYNRMPHSTSFFLSIINYINVAPITPADAQQMIQELLDPPGEQPATSLPASQRRGRSAAQPPATENYPTQAWSDAEIAMILRVAGTHPYLLLQTCAIYYDLYPLVGDRDQATLDNLEQRLIAEALRQDAIRQLLAFYWEKSSAIEQQRLIESANGGNYSIKDGNQHAEILHLAKRSLLIASQAGTQYDLFSEVFASFIRLQASRMPEPVSALTSIEGILSPVEMRLWRYLQSRPRQLIVIDELITGVWDGNHVGRNNLDGILFALRRKLDSAGYRGAEVIRNLRGKGYEFHPEAMSG